MSDTNAVATAPRVDSAIGCSLERGTEKYPERVMAGSSGGGVPSSMKNSILKQTTIDLGLVLLFGLLGGCAETTSSYANRRPLTASRDSSGPVQDPDIIDGGVRIPVNTYYNWPPIGDQGPR
ncbi:MAG: hypothetical protein QOI07_2583 [Verrucomicrobiota bacterium]|jgi:hypothetical protein